MKRRYAWWLLLLSGVALLLFALNVSRPGRRVAGCPAGCETANEHPGDTLRVLSMNVLHGFPHFEHLTARLDLIADEIRRQDVDIALLQEVPWNGHLGSGAEYLARRSGLNYLYLRANGNRHTIRFEEGEAILSRFPLTGTGFVELKPQASFFEHRVVLHATALTPWGSVDLFATHLTTGEPALNQAQVAALQAFVNQTGTAPALVGGDFNAGPETPQIQALARRWVDTYRTANPEDAGLTCCVDDLIGGPDQPLTKRIDYLFFVPRGAGLELDGAWRVLHEPARTAAGWQWASDHVGVLAEFRP